MQGRPFGLAKLRSACGVVWKAETAAAVASPVLIHGKVRRSLQERISPLRCGEAPAQPPATARASGLIEPPHGRGARLEGGGGGQWPQGDAPGHLHLWPLYVKECLKITIKIPA